MHDSGETLKLKNWALIAEILSAVAVVLSLIFVGFEVRQNSRTQVQTATQAALRDFTSASRLFSANNEIACIYLRGNQDYESLSDVEKFRYSSHLLHNFRAVQEMHSLLQEGAIDFDAWRSLDSISRETLHRPGVQQWLSTRRQWFTDEFQVYLEEVTSNSPPVDSVFYDPEGCSDGEL